MDARAVLDELQARGAVATVRDGVLCITPRTAIDDNLRAEIRCCKSELLQVLAEEITPSHQNTPHHREAAKGRQATKGEAAPRQNPAASTCSRARNRVALALPTTAQRDAITPETFAGAELLRQRLVASGVVLRVGCNAGPLRFDEPRLLVEFNHIARDDWLALLGCIAEMQKIVEHSMSNNAPSQKATTENLPARNTG
jgi:hypothetical protein